MCYRSANAQIGQQMLEIEAGDRIPNLLSDTVFKTIFDPDTQGNRLSDLFSCIFGKKVKILHSLNREGLHDSLYSKGIILDLVVQSEGQSVDSECRGDALLLLR